MYFIFVLLFSHISYQTGYSRHTCI